MLLGMVDVVNIDLAGVVIQLGEKTYTAQRIFAIAWVR